LLRKKPGLLAFLLAILLIFPSNYVIASGEESEVFKNPPREEIAQKLETIAKAKNIPSAILKAVAYVESSWRQFDSNGNVLSNNTEQPGLGIMQITSYDPTNIELVNKLKFDIDFNIAFGADLLNKKWDVVPKIGDGDRNKLENWYFALWAYNNWSIRNNPNNAAARNEVAYQDKIISKAATAYFQGLVTPVQIKPIPPDLLPLDTVPGRSQTWNTPQPYTLGDLNGNSNNSPDQKKTIGTTLRIVGQDRIDTVNQIALTGWPSGTETVILTRADSFPDALAGVALAKKYNAPILCTDPDQLDEGVVEVLNILRPLKVIILGGQKAVSQAVETKLKNVLYWSGDIQRIAGADRFETAVLIAQQFPNSSGVALATGLDFPDALSLASAAAGSGIPLLLSSTGELPHATGKMLKQISPQKVYIAGGEKVIPADVVEELTHTYGIPLENIVRFSGNNRYETSVKIAETFYPQTQEIYLATGQDFTDPLAAGVLASVQNACLLLISPEGFMIEGPTENYLKKMPYPTDVKVIGSEKNITENTITRVKYLLKQI